MTARRRLDAEMVRRGIVSSRTQARALIDGRRVRVGGAAADKASRLVHPAEAVVLSGERPRYVSRAGRKLEAALDVFGIDPSGLRAIDVGASTGGFTDCLLQHGAARVVAVDVGSNQLHERLRHDERVEPFERTDVRGIDLARIGGPAPLVVADLSFISVRAVAADLLRLAAAELVVLVKPQFEAGKREADRGRGVIRDRQVWHRTLLAACGAVAGAGAAVAGVMVSPVTGSKGNREFLMHADVRPGASGTSVEDTVDAAVRQADAEPQQPGSV